MFECGKSVASARRGHAERLSRLIPPNDTMAAVYGIAERGTVPLVYLSDDAGLILVASNFGGEHHPGCCHNLIDNPNVEVLAGDRSGYVARTGRRTIPLIRLKRVLRVRDRVLGHPRAPERE
jgi:hypothetical protein